MSKSSHKGNQKIYTFLSALSSVDRGKEEDYAYISMAVNEEKIVKGIIELKEDIKEIRREMMMQADKREILDAIANLSTVVKKIHDDHLFAIEWMKRLQEKVEEQQKLIEHQANEIKQIKLHLGIA